MQITNARGQFFFDPLAHLLHHGGVDAEEVVPTHAWLSWHAGGDDDDIGILERAVRLGPGEFRIETFDRRGFDDIKCFAVRNALDNVIEHDIAKLFKPHQMGQRAANIARADERDLAS